MWAGLVTIYGGARELAKLVWAETNKMCYGYTEVGGGVRRRPCGVAPPGLMVSSLR